MKKVSTLFLAVVSIFAFSSCETAELGPVMSTTPGSPSITAPESGQSYTLTEENAKDTLFTMEWTEPDYGFPSATAYTVEFGEPGQDFANAIPLATVNGTSYSITVEGMNMTMLGADYPFGQETLLEFRVVASVADSAEKQVSESITLGITPYSICRFCPEIYVAGGYQGASGYTSDWSPSDAPALTTINDQDQYEGYVYMANPGSQFKFTAERNWSGGDWGDNGADGTLDPGGANIAAADAGFYKINVDLNALTYSLTNTNWGIIGDATAGGWGADQDMTYDPANKVWTITTDLTGGKFLKFRANDAWTINYGDNGADGSLEAGGANIAIGETGNYTIELDLSGNPYTYTITKN